VANVQFGGLITGLNTNALIQGLVQAEQGPINILQGQKATLQAQQAVYTTLVSSLATLKSDAQGLSLSTDFNKHSAASSDSTVLTASADSTAVAGYNTVVVDTLAKAGSIESTPFTSSSDSIGTGALTIQVGGTSTPITIDSTNNTLAGLKSAINSSGAAVTASIVNVGTNASPDYRLIVQSKDTGIANAVAITSTLAGGTDPFAGGGQVVQAAADAVVSVNGLTVTRSSNTISDVIPGVTFVLLKEGNHDGLVTSADVSANVTVSVDASAVQSSIQKLVDSYNAVNKIVNDQFTLNPDTKRQGPLAGDAALRGVISRLRKELSASGGIGAGLQYLSDIGVTFEKDGSLTIDDGKLSNALQTDPTGVSNLFSLLQDGIGKRIPDTVDDFISSVNGSLTARQQGIQDDIKRIDQKVASEQQRITAFQDRLTQQFSDLEKTVSQLQSQSNFLLQNFASTLLSSNSQSLASSPRGSSLGSSNTTSTNGG
jgi:flagellar hook-associated protein 2